MARVCCVGLITHSQKIGIGIGIECNMYDRGRYRLVTDEVREHLSLESSVVFVTETTSGGKNRV